jgi:RimJ/RimL family protein N-acetyltransferase
MCFREKMPLEWMNASAIWLPANKQRLDHLLHDPIEASPAFIHASLKYPLNQFVFWERSGHPRIRGWALVHGTRDSCTWSVIKGDEFCFKTYLQTLNPAEKAVFEYVRDDERGYYARILGVEPVPFAQYYETTRDAFYAQTMDPIDLLLPEPFKLHVFDPARAHDWIAFQGYPAEEPAFSIYPRLNGLCATRNGSIIASVHDGLSLLPFQVPEAAINGVKVAESERGKGICTALLRVFMDRLFSSDKQRVGLFVDIDNKPAMRCYERAGLAKKQVYYKVELDRAKSSS